MSRFVQSSLFGCRETVGKIKETLVSPSFFLFWFMYWISNKTIKKDQSFIFFLSLNWFVGLIFFFFFFFFFWFCFARCSVCGLISCKFQISILNYALFCNDDGYERPRSLMKLYEKYLQTVFCSGSSWTGRVFIIFIFFCKAQF